MSVVKRDKWNRQLAAFTEALREEEKSDQTIAKYVRDTRRFLAFVSREPLSKSTVMDYRSALCARYRTASINAMLSSVNRFLHFIGHDECKVKLIKAQRCMFRQRERELTRQEYLRLLDEAQRGGRERLSLVMQTICATGMRISELNFVTVEAVKRGRAEVDLKGKRRVVLLSKKLQSRLTQYIRKCGIGQGAVFVTRSGKPLDRSFIWKEMKSLCAAAGVDPHKVFPHNLRHLFAREFYALDHDFAKLADLLGHSSIETTRIYIVESGDNHLRKLEHLRLVI